MLDLKWPEDANYCARWICGVSYLVRWVCLVYFCWADEVCWLCGLFPEMKQVDASDRALLGALNWSSFIVGAVAAGASVQ